MQTKNTRLKALKEIKEQVSLRIASSAVIEVSLEICMQNDEQKKEQAELQQWLGGKQAEYKTVAAEYNTVSCPSILLLLLFRVGAEHSLRFACALRRVRAGGESRHDY